MSRASTAWSLALLLGLGAVPSRALAQDQPPLDQLQQLPQGQAVRPEGEERAPAYIASVDGAARLDREGRSEAAERGVPLVPGDRLRTEAEASGVFGVPTFVFENEMFWGGDRIFLLRERLDERGVGRRR